VQLEIGCLTECVYAEKQICVEYDRYDERLCYYNNSTAHSVTNHHHHHHQQQQQPLTKQVHTAYLLTCYNGRHLSLWCRQHLLTADVN